MWSMNYKKFICILLSVLLINVPFLESQAEDNKFPTGRIDPAGYYVLEGDSYYTIIPDISKTLEYIPETPNDGLTFDVDENGKIESITYQVVSNKRAIPNRPTWRTTRIIM